jgi:hypothetical protein
LEEPKKLKELLQGAWRVFNAEVTGVKGKIPGVGDVGISGDGNKFTLGLGIGEITAKAKDDAKLREGLNQFLGPRKTQLIEVINTELLESTIAKLKAQGKKGLVAIVDNLDRIDNRAKAWGKPQQEYLFVDQGEYFKKLHCHLVYTMPLALKFSNSYANLTQRFDDPKVLPMVPVRSPARNNHEGGMKLLRQMVLARTFSHWDEQQRLGTIPEIFESAETLDSLCRVSGGHLRHLLKLLNAWIMEEMQFPLGGETLERITVDCRVELERERKQRLQTQEELEQAKRAKQRLEDENQKATHRIRIGTGIFTVSLIAAGIADGFALKTTQTLGEAREGTRIERQGLNALRTFEVYSIDGLV